jgi:hypothetical protein
MIDVQSVITLDEITQRPGMYLPARSIYCLKAYIDGINCGDQTDVWDYLDGFYEWLLDTFNHKRDLGMQCEMKLITHYMSHDGYDAYNQFFELVQEFRLGEEELPLFTALQERPYDFLPQKSIQCLYAFLWGKDAFAQGITEKVNLDGFQEFVQERYELETTWHKTILFYSQDEFSALNTFQTLYEEFIVQPSHSSDNIGNPMGDYLTL